jgi:outer membrane protein assembly factor BamB
MQSRLLAVRFTGEGDVTTSHIRWQSDRQIPQKPSLVIVGERLYFVSDQGIVRSLKTETGEEVWFKRLAGDYSASPLASGERLYFFNQSGLCTVIRAADEYQVLAENPLDSAVMASPAVSGNSLFVRTATSLYRIDEH